MQNGVPCNGFLKNNIEQYNTFNSKIHGTVIKAKNDTFIKKITNYGVCFSEHFRFVGISSLFVSKLMKDN
jgi:hypothetical protein